ncbi:MAG: BamA/TamA family outer membrane protein [Acidobacteriota bacterium]|nr:BamA/TamA family outer membrane protein [Acidobacteriota bacterium]
MRSLLVCMVTALILGLAIPADAQYFGRNKVQHQRFDFKVLTSEHFDVYYYPEEEAAVRLATRMAERWYSRLSHLLKHELSSRQKLILYAAHPHFQQTNVLNGEIGEGTGGVTESAKRRVILPFAGGLAETDHVLGHELVHAFQYDMAGQTDLQGRPVGPGLQALPLWFIEGMAEYLSLGAVDANTAMWVREASSRDAMPTIDKLDDPDVFPYRYGHAFWAYVAGRWGDHVVGEMLRATGPRGDIEGAVQVVLGTDAKTLSADWHAATRQSYAGVFESARAQMSGAPLISKASGGGDMNLAPALSPDGRRLIYLSERSLFSIDMYVADAITGRTTRKIVSTATDPHFDSLQFLSSAGDWAADNRRFVFAALSSGRPVLAIVDADTGRRERERKFENLDEIHNPAWSPDGRQVAFSAMRGGVLDLFVWTLANDELQQLTNDAYADLDPEWSPDGRELAWVTDRFSSDLTTLAFGNYRIGSMVVATRQMRELAGFATGGNSNPEFAADGTLFFIAAPDGIPNVYRLTRGAGAQAARVTNVLSGVSGITPLTPALSVAAAGPGVVFTVFENDGYNIYSSEGTRSAADSGLREGTNAAVLPPAERKAGEVTERLENPVRGLPEARVYPAEDYKPRLSLDAISQPTVGVGVDQFGAYGGGGVSFLFSDVLGEHMLGANVMVSNRLEETGGSIGYLNRQSRWNWGAIVEQAPYVTGAFAQGITTINGQDVIVQQSLRQRQTNQSASLIAQYPFSRVHRLEFAGGGRRISFDSQLETFYYSPVTGDLLGDEVTELPRPEALNLGEASAALVYDSSVFGATSPLVGQRYRLEFSQMAGSLSFSSVTADYRRYFMPVRPFTLAVRALHFGRYGAGGEDPRLPELYLGYPGLVRGYDVGSFDANECVEVDLASCDAFDQTKGSRIAVAGAEFRFPLLGLFNRSSFYGGFPLEMAFFGDAGLAWTEDNQPSFSGGERDWVRSAGVALRANVLGYAIAEIAYVRPFDRSRRGWVWQFGLMPGF